MGETLSPPPKVLRGIRWIITVGAPAGVVFIILLLAGVVVDPSMPPPRCGETCC